MNQNQEFVELLLRHGAQYRRGDRLHMPCPSCGAWNEKEEKFSASQDGRFNCFRCHFSGAGTAAIVELLGEPRDERPVHTLPGKLAPAPKRVHAWTKWSRNDYEARYTSDPRAVVRAWRAYKDIPVGVIRSRGLGLGVLPASRCKHTRLILPIFDRHGAVVNLRGRRIDCDCEAKWTASGGWTADKLMPYNLVEMPHREWGAVWITENPVDALMVNVTDETMWGVATLSASYWWERWGKAILARGGYRPVYMVAMDNDLVGNGGGKRRQEFLAAEAERRGREIKDFEPSGVKIANSLLTLSKGNDPEIYPHFRGEPAIVSLFEYPDDAPYKADLGWVFEQGGAE